MWFSKKSYFWKFVLLEYTLVNFLKIFLELVAKEIQFCWVPSMKKHCKISVVFTSLKIRKLVIKLPSNWWFSEVPNFFWNPSFYKTFPASIFLFFCKEKKTDKYNFPEECVWFWQIFDFHALSGTLQKYNYFYIKISKRKVDLWIFSFKKSMVWKNYKSNIQSLYYIGKYKQCK